VKESFLNPKSQAMHFLKLPLGQQHAVARKYLAHNAFCKL